MRLRVEVWAQTEPPRAASFPHENTGPEESQDPTFGGLAWRAVVGKLMILQPRVHCASRHILEPTVGKDKSFMKTKSFLLTLMLILTSLTWAQSAPPQTPPPPPAKGAEHHHQMADMHKQHMEGMKADVDKMKASLEQL